MTLKEFVDQIKFTKIKPTHAICPWHAGQFIQGKKYPLDYENVIFPEVDTYLQRFAPIALVNRMSTFAIGCIINKAVELMDDKLCFVNVGFWHGFTYFSGVVGNRKKCCVGIDNFSEFAGEDAKRAFLSTYNTVANDVLHTFFEDDFREVLQKYERLLDIGVYYYDGQHDYNSQLEGLELAEPFFSDDCVIFVDDTNWDAPRQATMDFLMNHPDEYDIIMDEKCRTSYGAHPAWWNGLIVLQRRTQDV